MTQKRGWNAPALKSTHTPAYREFLTSLVKRREELGLSQLSLGVQLQRNQSYVARVELAQTRLDLVDYIAWCRALDLDPLSTLAVLVRPANAPSVRRRAE